MKKLLIAFLPWLFSAFGYKAVAQEDLPSKKEKKEKTEKEAQEITIRRKGDKDAKIVIEMKGDKVTVNGQPLAEYKSDDVSVHNRTLTLHDGMIYNFNDNLDFDFDFDKESFKSSVIDAMGKRTFLGVTTEDDDAGARVTNVTKESAAAKAGIQKDDIITKIDDKKIENPEDLSEVIRNKKAKDNVKITVKRGGKDQTLTATLEERAGGTYSFATPGGSYRALTLPRTNISPALPKVQQWEGVDGAPRGFVESYGFRKPKLGLKIQDTDESIGVKVLDVEQNSTAATAGLKKDDIITEIGGKKITNTDEAREELQENADKNSYTMKAKRGNSEMTFTLKIPKKLKTANL